MNKKLVFCIFSIIIFSISIFIISCSNKDKEEGLLINIGPEPKTLDPTYTETYDSSAYIAHTFEGLTSRDKDDKLIEGVAESWDISADYITYTFHLRTNAKWADGKIVTANDFVYAWRRAVDLKVASSASYQLNPVKNADKIINGELPIEDLGIKALDDFTLEVKLESPTTYFLDLLATTIYSPLRKDVIEKYGDTWTQEEYIGNGPFFVSSHINDDKIIMEKNTNYWNAENIIPNKITFVLLDNPNTIISSIENGNLYFGSNPPLQDIPKLKREGYVDYVPLLAIYFLSVNTTNETLKDKRVRKALSLAIDRNYITENVTKGGEIPAAALVPYSVFDIEGSFRDKGGDYFSLKEEDYKKNIEEAKRLLEEAGYPNGKNFPVIEYSVESQSSLNIFEAVQNMWKENLNIDAKVNQLEWGVFMNTTRGDKNFQIARSGWMGDYNDPMTFLDTFLSYSPQNTGSYYNKEYEDLVKSALTNGDKISRMETLHKAEDVLMEDMPFIPVYFYNRVILVRPELKDIMISSTIPPRFFYSYVEK